MSKLIMPALAMMLTATSAHAADRPTPVRAPSQMTSSEIKAFNEGLDSDDPQYIRCRKIEETGSLVKKVRTCKTNEQWRALADRVRDEMGTSMSGGTNGN